MAQKDFVDEPAFIDEPLQTAKEPDTYWGGFLKSLGQTAKDTGAGMVRGALKTIDPRTYLQMIEAKHTDERAWLDNPHGGPQRTQEFVRSLQQLSDPGAGGEAIGGLATGLVGPRLVTAGAKTLGPAMQQTGLSAYERLLKINRGNIENMPAFGKDLTSRSENIARALITDPHGQISKSGARNYGAATTALGEKVGEIVAKNPEARGPSSHFPEALAGGRHRWTNQLGPSADTSAYDAVVRDVMQNPKLTKSVKAMTEQVTANPHGEGFTVTEQPEVVGRTMIPRVRAATAQKLTQGTYRKIGDLNYGETKGPGIEAHKAAASGGRALLNEALPEVAPLNATIAKRIDLGDILNDAVFRSGKHNPLGLGEEILIAGHHPGLAAAALANRPMIGSPIARGLYRAGGAMTGQSTAALMRAAILAQLGQTPVPSH